jgi:myosin-9
MRFWAKGKHGEKKTTRVKPVTQSEASAFFADSDVTPSHQGPEGKSGQRRGACLDNICLLS